MKRCLTLLILLLLPLGARAEAPDSAGLILATGPATGTAYALGKDIAALGGKLGIAVSVTPSTGSIANLKRMGSPAANGAPPATLGLVQSDVLGFLARSQSASSKQLAGKVKLVLPLYREEVHILARRTIHSFGELSGKRVIVGEEGSGSAVTAANLFTLLKVKPAEQIRMKAPEGVIAVMAGEADAMIFVGGKPVPLFARLGKLKTEDGGKNAKLLQTVHFLPLHDDRLNREYFASQLSPQDYPFLTQPVPTVAVSTMLMALDQSAGTAPAVLERCSQIGRLAAGIRAHIGELRQSGHPKWREVEPNREIPGWPQDRCGAGDPASAIPRAEVLKLLEGDPVP